MAQLEILIFEILIKDRNSFFNRSPPWRCRPDCLRSLFKIRIVPSLATLKLVQGSHPDCHSQTEALIVADPEIGELIYNEMIARLLGPTPLIGGPATKYAVLLVINAVSLILIAAHSDTKRGGLLFLLSTLPHLFHERKITF